MASVTVPEDEAAADVAHVDDDRRPFPCCIDVHPRNTGMLGRIGHRLVSSADEGAGAGVDRCVGTDDEAHLDVVQRLDLAGDSFQLGTQRVALIGITLDQAA